jgi:hypothetical protein
MLSRLTEALCLLACFLLLLAIYTILAPMQ